MSHFIPAHKSIIPIHFYHFTNTFHLNKMHCSQKSLIHSSGTWCKACQRVEQQPRGWNLKKGQLCFSLSFRHLNLISHYLLTFLSLFSHPQHIFIFSRFKPSRKSEEAECSQMKPSDTSINPDCSNTAGL